MKKILIILLLFCSSCFAALANENFSGLYVNSLDEVLRLDSKEIDLATAVLITSEEWNENVYGRHYIRKVDELAYRIKGRLKKKGIRLNHHAIKDINFFLFHELGFESVEVADNPDDLFLHSVLDNKQGYCLSLSILYLAIGERLGLPVYGVVIPGHFFVRYDDGSVRFNIETTSKGGITDDEHYIKNFDIPDGDNIYLQNLDKRQSLGCFFNNLGNCYMSVGDTKSAVLALERAIDVNPSLAESRINLGNIYISNGQLEDALAEYNYAYAINPFDPKILNNLGNAYSQKGWGNDAVNQYLKAIRLDPNFVDAYKNLAGAYCEMGRYSQAVEKLKEALAIEPENASIFYQMGKTYLSMGRNKNALKYLQKALLRERDADTYYGIGLAHLGLGSDDEALRAFRKALVKDENLVGAAVGAGNIYFNQGYYETALEYYERANEIRPRDANVLFNLGTVLCNLQRYEESVSYFELLLELYPEQVDAHSGLAVTYFNLKEFELAREHYENAVSAGVEVSEEIAEALGD